MQIDGVVTAISSAGAGRQRAMQLAVVEAEGSWRMYLNGEAIARFQAHSDALQCALDLAAQAGRDGLSVEVLAQQPFGELRVLQVNAPTAQ